MMKFKGIILLIAIIISVCYGQNLIPLLQNAPVTVQVPGLVTPGDIRFTINATVNTYIKMGYPSTAIELKNDNYPFQLYAGYRSIESQDPINKDTIFRIASMSKMITSATVLKYVEDGLIDLDDDVSKYIKSFNDATVIKKIDPVVYSFNTMETVSGSQLITVSLPGLSVLDLAKLNRRSVAIQLASPLSGVKIEGIFTVMSIAPIARTITVVLDCPPTVTGTFAVNGTLDVMPLICIRCSPYDYVYVPSNASNPLQKSRVYYATEPSRPVTVKHLLTHTLGLEYATPGYTTSMASLQTAIMLKRDPSLVRFILNPNLDMDVVEYAERMARIPMQFQPGTGWVYGPQIGIAGAVLIAYERSQACSTVGITLYDIQKRVIFDKLNITDAGYFIQNNDPRRSYKISKLAHVYVNADTFLTKIPTVTTPFTSMFTNLQDQILPGLQSTLIDGPNPTNEALNSNHPIYGAYSPRKLELGDAGLYMRTDELQRIVTMLQQNGTYDGQQILKASTVKSMFSNQIGDIFIVHSLAPLGNVKWGYGVAVEDGSVSPTPLDKTSGHWAGAFAGWWYLDVSSKTAFSLNTNVLPGGYYQPFVNSIANVTNS